VRAGAGAGANVGLGALPKLIGFAPIGARKSCMANS